MLKRILLLLLLALPLPARAQLANIKITTDASPDYSDMHSMIHSITANQKTDADKMYALFYWDHLARRQTYQPMRLHGSEISDPIRQYNDYGYVYFASAGGIKCSEWNYMGYPCRYFGGIADVYYDGKFHAYDNAYSALFALEDGKTIASVEDLARSIAGPETDNKPTPAYLVLYRCLTATGPASYLQGSDTDRSLVDLAPQYAGAKQSYYYAFYNQERAHRYILNLRPGESYTRYYKRQDTQSPHAIVWDQNNAPSYKSDPAYFVHNGLDNLGNPSDPEALYPGYHIRGNGDRTFTPPLSNPAAFYSSTNTTFTDNTLRAKDPSQPAIAIFKIEGANVITSLKLRALLQTPAKNDTAAIALSTTNGLTWSEIWNSKNTQDSGPGGGKTQNSVDLKLVDPLNGKYEALVRITLKNAATLSELSFNTLTQVNSKTQPQLHIGANTVYVGVGEQTNSTTLYPDLHNLDTPFVVDRQNIRVSPIDIFHSGVGTALPQKPEPAHLTFKLDAPTDVTGFTFGGRLSNRSAKSHIDFLHSLDDGKTWQKDYSLAEAQMPSDTIHFESIRNIPPGTRSVLFKYELHPDPALADSCSLYSVHMELNHKLSNAGVSPAPAAQPLEVTFHWSERQQDYSLVTRSHTQLVDHFPFTYQINVAGADHPIVDSLAINFKGQRPDVHYGYSNPDEAPKDAKRWIGTWATYGNNLALHKPYTVSKPSADHWGSGDPQLKKLTDGVVGSNFSAGGRFGPAASWNGNTNPEITVDLGAPQKCAAFRIQTLGWEPWDALKGQNKDHIEVFTSLDGKQYTSAGVFNCNLRFKDIPLNVMIPDDETLGGCNFLLPLETPIEARYIKYKITTPRIIGVTEVQALDSWKIEPHDLPIALPDPAQNGQPAPNPDLSPIPKTWPENFTPPIGQPLQ